MLNEFNIKVRTTENFARKSFTKYFFSHVKKSKQNIGSKILKGQNRLFENNVVKDATNRQ